MGDGVVLALDFGGSKIAVAVADRHGRRLADSVVGTEPALGARFNFEQGVSTARRLLSQLASEDDLLSVGACTFGIPTPEGIRLAPAIPGWGELSLALELAAAFGTRAVRVATDVKAAAAAEAATGALAGYDPAIYVNLGTGLAIGIVCGGKVVAGANGAAGEIGYSLRQPADVDLDAADRVVLEEVVSGMGISASSLRRTGEARSAADVFAQEDEDSRLAGVLGDVVRELCFHIVNLAVALDPARIAVGGGMVRSWDRLATPLRAALDASVPYPPELVVGAYPFDAALVGAIALGVKAAADLDGADEPATDGLATDGASHTEREHFPVAVRVGQDGGNAESDR